MVNDLLLKEQILKKESKKGFSLLAGINRDVIPSHVTKIANSILKTGCGRSIIVAQLSFIEGVVKWYIIDGQHLYYALIRLNQDFPYKIIENITTQEELVECIACYNHSSKSWTMVDYIKAWSSVNPDYKTLKTACDTYDIELSIISPILMNVEIGGSVGSSPTLNHIKKGTFFIDDYTKSKITLDYLTDIFKIIKRLNRHQNRYVCSEFVKLIRGIKDYNHIRFMKNLSANKDNFLLATHEEGALGDMFNKLLK